MASTIAKAKRHEAALVALQAECDRLAAQFKLSAPDVRGTAKDPDIARAQVLEAVTSFLSVLRWPAGRGKGASAAVTQPPEGADDGE